MHIQSQTYKPSHPGAEKQQKTQPLLPWVGVNAEYGAALKLLTNGRFHLEDKIERESSKNLYLYSFH